MLHLFSKNAMMPGDDYLILYGDKIIFIKQFVNYFIGFVSFTIVLAFVSATKNCFAFLVIF